MLENNLFLKILHFVAGHMGCFSFTKHNASMDMDIQIYV